MFEFNAEETKKMQAKPIYVEYRRWLEKCNVLLHPSIIYPAYFGEKGKGTVGVATSKALPKNQAVMAIPYDIMITIDTVKNNQMLMKIVDENPDIFQIKPDAMLKILILYLSVELLKKKQSFYAPYFAIATQSYLENWSKIDRIALENKKVMKLMRQKQEEQERQFMDFLKIYRRYPHVFPIQTPNRQYKQIFDFAYSFISTRAFGWSLPSISLIPMADSLNHSNNYLVHFLMDIEQQQKPHISYTTIYHKKYDLSLLSQQQIITPEKQLSAYRKTKRTRKQKFVLKHKQIINQEKTKLKNEHIHILHQQYKAKVRNMRQLHFYDESCSEDNDTDEQTIENHTINVEKYLFHEKYELETLTDKNKKQKLRKYWKIYTQEDQEEDEDDQEQMIEPIEEVNIEKAKKQLMEHGKSSQGSSLVSSTDSEDDNEDFDWLKEKKSLNTTYFIVCTRQPEKQCNQLFNFYGRRSNRFLLLNYNFVLEDNKYDSYEFELAIFPDFKKIPASKLIYTGKPAGQHTKPIRLKGQRINLDLINHCRALLIGWNKIDQFNYVKVTIPFNLDFQRKVLALAIDIIRDLRQSYETSLEEDQQFLDLSKKHETTMAILMRYNHKAILEKQLFLLTKCLQMLKVYKKGEFIIKQSQMQDVGKIRLYLEEIERSKI